MERSKTGLIVSVTKIFASLALMFAVVSMSGRVVHAQRVTMGPSPDLVVKDVIRDLPNSRFLVRYCNMGDGLATATMTVSLTNNGNSVQAMSVANQVVPSGNGACASTPFPCSAFGDCYAAKNFRIVVDTLGQIYEGVAGSPGESNNVLASFILNPLPGLPTPVSIACVLNSSNQIQVNLSWGNGQDTTSSTITIDDPSTSANPDHTRAGITALVYPVTYSYANNAFAGKSVTGKVWGVNSLGSGQVANFSTANCPTIPTPFNKTGPASGASLTPGSQTFSWSKYTGSGGFNQYLITFTNASGTVVMTRRIADINATNTSVNLWQSGDSPAAGDTVLVKPPFAIGAYSWQITASAGGTASVSANNNTPWNFVLAESAACKPQNMRVTCGVNGNAEKATLTWTSYGRPILSRMDNYKNGWLNPAFKGDYMFILPGSTYPEGIASVTSGSYIADIDTNQQYGWSIQDWASGNAGSTACRTDMTFSCPAASPTQTPEQTACTAAGGTWRLLPNSCVDRCGAGPTCLQVITAGCDCGGDKCWNGTSCVGNPTVTPPPVTCVCKSDNTCDASCTYTKYSTSELSNVSYANPIGCSLASVPFSSTPSQANKNAWCQRPLRTQGEADGSSAVDSKDYFYYVQAVAGGSLPSDSNNNVNPDFNGNGSVGTEDRIIIIKKLGGV